MSLPEVIANSPVPGTDSPIAYLQNNNGGIGTNLSTFNVTSPAPTELWGGQFRILIDSELILVLSGQSTTTWTVQRAVESTSATVHMDGTPIYHILTAGALNTRFGVVGTDGTIGGPQGTPLNPGAVFISGTVSIGDGPQWNGSEWVGVQGNLTLSQVIAVNAVLAS
jgi:hypothetical protein